MNDVYETNIYHLQLSLWIKTTVPKLGVGDCNYDFAE